MSNQRLAHWTTLRRRVLIIQLVSNNKTDELCHFIRDEQNENYQALFANPDLNIIFVFSLLFLIFFLSASFINSIVVVCVCVALKSGSTCWMLKWHKKKPWHQPGQAVVGGIQLNYMKEKRIWVEAIDSMHIVVCLIHWRFSNCGSLSASQPTKSESFWMFDYAKEWLLAKFPAENPTNVDLSRIRASHSNYLMFWMIKQQKRCQNSNLNLLFKSECAQNIDICVYDQPDYRYQDFSVQWLRFSDFPKC